MLSFVTVDCKMCTFCFNVATWFTTSLVVDDEACFDATCRYIQGVTPKLPIKATSPVIKKINKLIITVFYGL